MRSPEAIQAEMKALTKRNIEGDIGPEEFHQQNEKLVEEYAEAKAAAASQQAAAKATSDQVGNRNVEKMRALAVKIHGKEAVEAKPALVTTVTTIVNDHFKQLAQEAQTAGKPSDQITRELWDRWDGGFDKELELIHQTQYNGEVAAAGDSGEKKKPDKESAAKAKSAAADAVKASVDDKAATGAPTGADQKDEKMNKDAQEYLDNMMHGREMSVAQEENGIEALMRHVSTDPHTGELEDGVIIPHAPAQ